MMILHIFKHPLKLRILTRLKKHPFFPSFHFFAKKSVIFEKKHGFQPLKKLRELIFISLKVKVYLHKSE